MAGHDVSPIREAAVCLCLIGLVMVFIALIGVEWAVPVTGSGGGTESFEGVGLWRYCYREGNPSGGGEVRYVCDSLVGNPITPGWYKAVQATIIIGVCFYVMAFLSVITVTCCASWRQDRRVLFAFLVNEIIAIIFSISGICVFSQNLPSAFPGKYAELKLGWCFILSTVSALLAIVPVILGFIELFRSRSTIPMQRFDNELHTQSRRPPSTPLGGVQRAVTATEVASSTDNMPVQTVHIKTESPTESST